MLFLYIQQIKNLYFKKDNNYFLNDFLLMHIDYLNVLNVLKLNFFLK